MHNYDRPDTYGPVRTIYHKSLKEREVSLLTH